MSTYTPDTWVVIEFTGPQLDEPLQKVFAGWYNGLAVGDSWKLNSGIATATKDEFGVYEFMGNSGSCYRCHENNYYMSSLQHSVLASWQKSTENTQITIRILSLDEIVVS
jgi:hypothetical protein